MKNHGHLTQMMLVIVDGVSINTFKDMNHEKITKYHSKMVEDGTLGVYAGDYVDVLKNHKLSGRVNNIDEEDCNIWDAVRKWLPATSSNINTVLEMVPPAVYKHSVSQDLFNVIYKLQYKTKCEYK